MEDEKLKMEDEKQRQKKLKKQIENAKRIRRPEPKRTEYHRAYRALQQEKMMATLSNVQRLLDLVAVSAEMKRHDVPMTEKRILRMIARGRGPKAVAIYGKQPLFEEEEILEWIGRMKRMVHQDRGNYLPGEGVAVAAMA